MLQHFDLAHFLEILTKVISQCSVMYLSTSALLVLVEGWVTSFFCAIPGVERPNFVK